jgi:TonB-linked SusC/RagA family outer membrane protein
MRSNVDINLTKTTLMRFNIGGYMQDRNSPAQGIDDLFNQAFAIPPWQHPTRYSSGEIPRVPERVNPWALATQKGYERYAENKLETLFSVEQGLDFLLPGLKVKGTFAFDIWAKNGVRRAKDPDYYVPATGRDPETGALYLTIASYGQEFLGHDRITDDWGNKSNYLEGIVSWNQTYGDHDFQTMLLYNQRHYDNGDKLPFRNQGIAGRLSYMYKQRYIGEVNFGYNGSENFAQGSRYGFFPSAAIGWIVSDEAFMEPLRNVLSKVKLRASYGLVGNDQLGTRFAYISTINETTEYKWGTSADFRRAGRWEGTVGNPNLTWETVAKMNFGIELGFMNALELQVDYFVDNRSNIFMQRKSVPSSAGFSELPYANFGKVQNRGIDASIIANRQFGDDWYVSLRGSFTYAQNEIVEQDEALTVIGTTRSVTGKPVNQLFGLIAEGLFTEDDFADVATGKLKDGVPTHTFNPVRPGDIKYRDISEDGQIDALDRTAIGTTEDPQIVYGFGFSMRYKDFDFGAFLQGNAKTDRIIGREGGFLPGSGNGVIGNFFTDVIDNRWTVDNPSQDVFYPRASLGTNDNNRQESTWWLTDMSMLRVKNVELGYNLPSTLLRKVMMKHARVYLRGTNILTLSKFKLWDPELANSVGTRYPLMKSYSVGLEITF